MAKAFLNISSELLIEICKGLHEGDDIRFYQVIENGLPKDTKYLGTLFEENRVKIIIESDKFEEGENITPTLKSVSKSND
jgi:hypothetical protein